MAQQERYDSYCVADPLFYDVLTSESARATFAIADRPVPTGWHTEPLDDWLIYAPVDGKLPQQGWKIHISATLANAERVLDRVWDYCVPRELPFKFLHGPRALLMRNSKYAARGSSGKFVTIYPRDDAELELTCKELDELLAGEEGPYILSDLRYGAGPVFVRYGAFAAQYCLSADGDVVPALADDTGTLVPDRRDPVFHLPSWVTLPDFLAPHLAARNATGTGDLPYQIEKVIHFSNGGGLYIGRDTRSDTQVVLKEARPHAGLDATGTDAVARLTREAAMLRRLADLPQVPRVHDEFTLGEHRFLVLEFIEGRPLNKLVVEKYPLINADATEADRATYADWARGILDQIESVLTAIHAHGLVYGDLHLFNVMVRPDDTVALVDFEVTAEIGENRPPGLRNQGFAAPRDRVGVAVDQYALACLRLALFMPLTQLFRLSPGKAAELADTIAEEFAIPRDYLDRAVAEIVGRPAVPVDPSETTTPSTAVATTGAVARSTGNAATAVDYDDWPQLRSRLAEAILASATPQREDRLFPGDIEQFRCGGLNLAYGAAGVLHALAVTGAGRRPEHEQWLIRRAKTPASGSRLGFYDGLHGVAYALAHLDHRQEALDVVDICLREQWEQFGLDLLGGLPGIVLNLAELGARIGETTLTEAAWRGAERVVDRLGEEPRGELSGGKFPYAGLLRGRTGAALMCLRLHELNGDPALLDAAAVALRQDLRRCVVRPDGAMEINEGWRTMPYLAEGSVGIGLVLEQYLTHRADDQFAEASAAIRLAARSPFYAQSGLFAGRAGIIAYLTGTGDPQLRGQADHQIRQLAWHAMPYRGAVAFPGEQLLRLSMDLATGTAGVLLAVGTARHDEPVNLPFLAPLTGATRLPRGSGGASSDRVDAKEVN